MLRSFARAVLTLSRPHSMEPDLQREVADLRADVAGIARRIENIEACLKLVWGPGALGGGPRPAAPPPEPEPEPRRSKMIGSFGGHFMR